ncbi:hypothetical protein NEUTE2DRAFT_67015, partial [Neurospora tetrasperma FGSC 2509]
YEYILIVINKLTKIQYFIPVEGVLIYELIKRFINYIHTLYNLPNTIISNRNI